MRGAGGDDTVSRAAPQAADRRDADMVEVAKGTGVTAAASMFEYASRFIIAFLLTRALGVDQYGLYTVAISVAAIFTGFATFGLDDALVRYVSIQSGRQDRKGVAGTLQIALGLPLVFGLSLGLAMFFSAEIIAVQVFDEPRLSEPLQVMAAVVPILSFSNVLLGATRGFRRMDYAALAENVIQTIIRLGLLAALSIVGFDVITAIIVFGIADLGAAVTMIVLLQRLFPLRAVVGGDVRRESREIIGFAIPMWLSGLLTQFRKNIQDVILAFFGVIAEVGIFALASRVNVVGRVFYRSVVVAVKPLLAQGHDQGDRDRLGQIYRMATRWLVALNLPFFLAMVLYPEAILSVFGREFAAGAAALSVLAWGELINAATGVCGSMIDMGGYTRVKLFNSVMLLVFLLSSSLVLIPRFGVLGAAFASLFSVTAINLIRISQVWFIDRLQPFDVSLWKPLVAAIAGYAAGVGLDRAVPHGADLATSFWQGAIVTSVYAALLTSFGIDNEDRRLLGKIGRRLSRRTRPTGGRA